MTDTLSILEDKRQISSIHWDDELDSRFMVGEVCVERIEAYGEPGQYCMLPWFAIWKDGKVVQRVNGSHISRIAYVEN